VRVFGTDYRRWDMFNAPHCRCCGEKEHKNGYGCNNPKCKEYYKLKWSKNTEQPTIEEE